MIASVQSMQASRYRVHGWIGIPVIYVSRYQARTS